jgi:hypothetical protein
MFDVQDYLNSPRFFSRRGFLTAAGAGVLSPSLTKGAEEHVMLAVNMDTIQPLDTFAHLAYGTFPEGGSFKTSFVFMNLGGSDADLQLVTYATDGVGLAVPVVGGTRASQHVFTVPGNGSIVIDLDDTSDPITRGWAGVISGGTLRGQGIYRQRVPGRPDYEAVAPMLSRAEPDCIIPFPPSAGTTTLAMPLDNSSGFVTSVAFANTAPAPRTLDLEFVDEQGASIFTAHESLAAHNQISFATWERYPVLSGQKGWMRVLTTPTDFSAIGFRFNPTGAFTTYLPVLR